MGMRLTMPRHERSPKPRSFSHVHDMPTPRVNWHAPSGMLRREGAATLSSKVITEGVQGAAYVEVVRVGCLVGVCVCVGGWVWVGL